MDLANCKVMKHEYTYKDLTKPANRENMRELGVTTLGTKSGGFGPFQPQFKVVSLDSLKSVKLEMMDISFAQPMDLQSIIDRCPTLKELLK